MYIRAVIGVNKALPKVLTKAFIWHSHFSLYHNDHTANSFTGFPQINLCVTTSCPLGGRLFHAPFAQPFELIVVAFDKLWEFSHVSLWCIASHQYSVQVMNLSNCSWISQSHTKTPANHNNVSYYTDGLTATRRRLWSSLHPRWASVADVIINHTASLLTLQWIWPPSPQNFLSLCTFHTF